jgi:GNAT superfamily N-acetyltransferase
MPHPNRRSDPIFRRYDAHAARAIRDIVELIHHEAYIAAIAAGDPFESGDTPMRRFDAYTSRDTFDLIVAYLDDTPVGQAWGWPLGSHSAWWNGLLGGVEPGFTDEDGTRTFAFSELMVRQAWSGQGIGHALHDALLSHRTERRATLLVRPDNTVAYRAYTRWGWHKAAQMRPGIPHAPLMDVLILPLPLKTTG